MIQINTLEEFSNVQDYYYVERDTIYSKWSGELKPLKPGKVDGYHQVGLQTKDTKQRQCLVHRIVCTAYNPNPGNLPEVNHINHDRLDNRPENLEWVTKEGNTKDDSKWRKCQRTKKVMLKDVENCRVIVFQSATQCAKYLGVHKTAVSHAIKHGTKCKGYVLKKYKINKFTD